MRHLTLARATGGGVWGLDFSAEQVRFRDPVRTWLAENAPRGIRPSGPAIREYDLGWQRTQWEGGWAGIAWPTEYGGRGLSLIDQLIWVAGYGRGRPPRGAAHLGGL